MAGSGIKVTPRDRRRSLRRSRDATEIAFDIARPASELSFLIDAAGRSDVEQPPPGFDARFPV
jgi:hypothetical protein